MVWTLTTTVKVKQTKRGKAVQIDSDSVKAGKTFIIENDTNEYLDVLIDADIPSVGIIRVDPKNPPKEYFTLVSKTSTGTLKTYTLKYLGEQAVINRPHKRHHSLI